MVRSMYSMRYKLSLFITTYIVEAVFQSHANRILSATFNLVFNEAVSSRRRNLFMIFQFTDDDQMESVIKLMHNLILPLFWIL